jgi:predicted negative regulator of RcsB-dependent stress response
MRAGVVELIELLAPYAPRDAIEVARDAVDHNEWIMALEDLCVNLYEADARLPRALILRAMEVLVSLGAAKEDWDFLWSLEEWPKS